MTIKTVFLAIVLLGVSGAAFAERDEGGSRQARDSHGGLYQQVQPKVSAMTLQAPEVDSASLVAALTLLGGALIVMRGRRASKTPV